MNAKLQYSQQENILLKWNPLGFFHKLAPDTIKIHCAILKKYDATPNNYVWWGKVSKSGRFGVTEKDLINIKEQIETTQKTSNLYLYCPDSDKPTLHVGKLEGIALDDKRNDSNCPSYYSELTQKIPFWFKITDIKKIPMDLLSNLMCKNGEQFDPVSSNAYPIIVYEKNQQVFFNQIKNYKSILEDYVMRCFKTGGVCAIPNIETIPNRIFIGRPFSTQHQNIYKYAIKPVVEEMEFEAWKADEVFKNIDLMCKVCEGIQSSRAAIIDISGWNSNVLFELGMVYGLSREALILKEDSQDVPVDLKGLIYISYNFSDFEPLQKQLKRYLEAWK